MEQTLYGGGLVVALSKMKIIHIVVLTLGAVISVSCKSVTAPIVAFQDYTVVAESPISIQLEAARKVKDVPMAVIDCKIIDSLCLFSLKDPEQGYFVICKPDFKPVRYAVKKGNAPNELITYQYFNDLSFRHESDSLIAYIKNTKKQICRWNITATLNTGDCVFERISPAIKSAFSVRYLYDSLAFVIRPHNNRRGIDRLLFNNGRYTVPDHFKELSRHEVDKDDGKSFNVLSMITAYNLGHDLIVEAGTVENIINIYSLDGTFKKSVQWGTSREFDVLDSSSWPMAYEHLDAYDQFIAALYLDDTERGHYKDGCILPSIRILDWSGNPLIELKLQYPATNFEFDFAKKRILTLNAEDESCYLYDVAILYEKYPEIFN
ncbi:MAG: hypothetical protein ACI3ZL_05395 [Candidatus Cryptobacteroides sp.]